LCGCAGALHASAAPFEGDASRDDDVSHADAAGDDAPPSGAGAPASELELYEEALEAAEAERTLALSALTDAVREREELSARLAELSRGALPAGDAASVALAAAQRRATELEMTNTFLQRQLAAKGGEEGADAAQARAHILRAPLRCPSAARTGCAPALTPRLTRVHACRVHRCRSPSAAVLQRP
jgi:hypothetical protein